MGETMTEERSLSEFMDFMEEADGFLTPPMPSEAHPEGKRYRVPSPSARVGARLNALADILVRQRAGGDGAVTEQDIARLRIPDHEERDFVRSVLGSAYDEMMQDDCRWEHMKRMGTYAFTRFAISEEAADEAVKAGLLRGKVQAPKPTNRSERRKKSKSKR
jgi:hypothetical protein